MMFFLLLAGFKIQCAQSCDRQTAARALSGHSPINHKRPKSRERHEPNLNIPRVHARPQPLNPKTLNPKTLKP